MDFKRASFATFMEGRLLPIQLSPIEIEKTHNFETVRNHISKIPLFFFLILCSAQLCLPFSHNTKKKKKKGGT